MDNIDALVELDRINMPPDLILMAGYPGVGKSAISVELAQALRYALFDIDDILITEVDKHSCIEAYQDRGRLAYKILMGLVSGQIQCGVSVIVDTPLTYHFRDFMFELRDRYDAAGHVIHCHCSDATAIARNEARLSLDPKKYAGRDAENFYRIQKVFEPIESIASISVNTERIVAENIKLILNYLREKN